MLGPVGCVRVVLPLIAALAIFVGTPSYAQAKLRAQIPSTEYVLQQSALIAHVRVAGKVDFGERSVQVVEILDSARGPVAGQLVLVDCDQDEENEREDDAWLPTKVGAHFILFAMRSEQGLYVPREEFRALLVTSDSAIADLDRMRQFLPPQTPPTALGVMAQLRAMCQRQQATLQVRVNNDDVTHYEPGHPLRVQITIANVGEGEIRFQNYIEYEYFHNTFVDVERQERLKAAFHSPPVKLCVRPIGRLRELQSLEEMLRRLSVELALSPGEQATGSYDLGEAFDLRGGGTFAVWAEWGGDRSPDVVLELPRAEEAVEMMEKLAELAREDDGPFHIERGSQRLSRSMPAVEPVVEGAAIEAALTYWFSSRLGGRHHTLDETTDEVVILRSAHISPEFTPKISGVQFLACDACWRKDGQPEKLSTSRGPGMFHWRAVRINAVHVQGANARVEIIQDERHNLGGSGATLQLRRNGGTWRVAEPVQMWQS